MTKIKVTQIESEYTPAWYWFTNGKVAGILWKK